MKIDLARNTAIGLSFRIESRRFGRIWEGAAQDICDQMRADGIDLQTWVEPMSRLTARVVAGEPMGYLAAQANSIPDLKEKAAQALRLCYSTRNNHSYRHEIERHWRDSIGLKVLVWCAWLVGCAAILEEIGDDLPRLSSSRDINGMTGLAWSCALGNERAVSVAIGQNMPLDPTNRFGWNLANLAQSNKRQAIADLLAKSGAPRATGLKELLVSMGIPMASA